ncbi:phosphoglycerate mutase [Nocardioides daphniae]|uniref:Histidine phosphatase family protein n=2 Tax=Nocardioides daphniae TaxID=402297 RepID=A0A4P7UKF6_9ACTN|nr:histidine phosphatase family protein [Nocardioides daphniae]GGD25878.1 phosphoglycerate mutase [Nocardioides daphniae]
MRHAKAEAVAASDLERALTERGRTEAAQAGEWLSGLGFVPDHALVSAAVRTRDTWACVAESAGWDLEPDVDSGLYAAGPEAAVDLLRLVPAEVTHLIVVGHNPTVSHVAQLLSDGQGDEAAARAMAGGHPTSACAVFDVEEEWSELGFGDGRLVAFHAGRD